MSMRPDACGPLLVQPTEHIPSRLPKHPDALGQPRGVLIGDFARQVTHSVLEGPEALSAIAAHWPKLYLRDPGASPYQSPGWITGWAKHLSPTTTPVAVLVHHRNGAPLAALALVREHADDGQTIRPLSSPHAEYIRPVGPLGDDPAVVLRILQALDLLACDAEVVLPDIPTGSELSTQLAYHPRWRPGTTSQRARVALPIAYWALPHPERQVQLRRRRQWGELIGDGRVDYRRTQTMAELLAAFDVLAQINQRQNKELHPASPDISTRRWRQVVQHVGPKVAFVATIAVDKRTIAAQLCLQHGPCCYSLITAMEPAKRDLAPGHALLRSLAHDLGRNGTASLDLGRTLHDEGQVAYRNQYGPTWSTTTTYTTNSSSSLTDGIEESSARSSSGSSAGASDRPARRSKR